MSAATPERLRTEVRRRRTFAIITHPDHTLHVRRGQAATRLTLLRGLREERGACDMFKSRHYGHPNHQGDRLCGHTRA